MRWRVVTRPQAGDDIIEAANWNDAQQTGLGDEFIDEVLEVFDALEVNRFYLVDVTRRRTYVGVIPTDFLTA